MTHTEESLMALACEFAKQDAVSRSGKSEPGALYAAMDALRLAIREVLNDRGAAYELLHRTEDEKRVQRERAEKAEEELATTKARLLEVQQDVRDLLGLKERAERAEAECERNRKDSERGRFMLKHVEWRRNSEYRTAHLAVAVPFDSDLSCYATREAAIDAAIQEKQP